MSAPAIRGMIPGDVAAAAQLHEAAFGAEAWNAKSIADTLSMARAAGLVALDEGNRLLGFALYLVAAQDADLLTLAVAPALRRRGIGTALVLAFIDAAAEAGAVQALLEVAEDNLPAQALYRRLDFKITGYRKDYYQRPDNRRVGARLLNRVIR